MKKAIILSMLVCVLSTQNYAQETITIYPDKDAHLQYTTRPGYTHYQTTNYGTHAYLRSEEWTTSGYPLQMKGLLGIDLSALPLTAYILEAKLYLYGTGNHMTDITTDNSGYKSNASYLRRVITSWNESTVTWDTAPTTVTDNQVTLSNSTTYYQNYEVNVTDLIKDIQRNPSSSDGLMLSLVTEEVYTEMRFASSDYTTSSMHPRLEIIYVVDQLVDKESFEDSNTKWENVDGDDIDWYRDSGGTPSSGTGPTSGSEGSYYAYVEASDTNHPNKKAYLQGPEYYLIGLDNAQIIFDYHMYGTGMGSLDLEISTNGGIYWNSIWAKSGNQGNSWHTAVVDLSSYIGGEVMMRFTGITGSSWTSDMAVDNIQITGIKAAEVSEDENYIFTVIPMSENGHSGAIQQNIQYFDGLGRIRQEVSAGSSPEGNDVIKPIDYDVFGLIEREYLPFAAEDNNFGAFRDYEATGDDVLDMQKSFYQDHFSLGSTDPYAYSRTVFEESPLNRIKEQGSPGVDWQPIEETSGSEEYVQTYELGSNVASEVRFFSVDMSNGNLVNSPTHYSADELIKSTFLNEDGNKTEEFKDKLGRVVLKRSFEDTDELSTYYVYDDVGLLRYVIPPKADGDNALPNSTKLSDLCYQYNYNERQKMEEKKLPGIEPVYMVYDNRDRLVAIQDGRMRHGIGESDDEWLITKYDRLNRPVLTAIYKPNVNWSTLITQVNGVSDFSESYVGNTATDINGYDNTGWPTSIISTDVRTVTYYDNYDFLSLSGFTGFTYDTSNNIDIYQDSDGNSNGHFDRVLNQITGSASLVLDGTGSNWIKMATYYDQKYRPIQSQSTFYPDGSNMVSTKYDFLGNILETLEIQDVNSVVSKARFTYIYDHSNRLMETYVTYNDESPICLSQNSYNELGELEEKDLHVTAQSSPTQSVDFSYNMRGWMTSINTPGSLSGDNDLFGMSLHYQDDIGIGNSELYNGNITAVRWSRAGNDTIRGYAYEYDELNRLLSGDYQQAMGSTWTDFSKFDTEYSYDMNGNIDSLNRYNASGFMTDELAYDYQGGNMLFQVDDADQSSDLYVDRSNQEFDYDANGNMTIHEDQQMSVNYNYLNLPEKIQTQISPGTDKIEYIYDASGVKWLKKSTIASSLTKTMYAGAFVYDDSDGDGTDDFGLDYILNPEGMIDTDQSTISYHYYLKDHLGNTRVIFDETGTQLQKPDYYPFGMSFEGTQNGDNKYLYNGKEIQDEQLGGVNLDWYDYGARMYDPALGRWHTQDPLAEKYYSLSSYNYVANNPVLFIDPDGMKIEYSDDTKRKDKREFKKAQRELNRKSATAKSNWKALKKSDNVHTVHVNTTDSETGEANSNHVDPKGDITNDGGNGTDIYINTNNEITDESGPLIISIGHEEGHAFRFDQGLVEMKSKISLNDPNGFDANMNAINRRRITEETEVSHIENIIRAEVDPTGNQIPLRKQYSNLPQYVKDPITGRYKVKQITINVVKDGYRYYKK